MKMKPHRLLWIAILLYIIVFSAIAFWKYDQLLYNGLDLAIYNNVIWNTSEGNWSRSSIHDPSYLGDHFEPLMLVLLPFYLLWRDPRMLLLLQTIILALTAIPIYKIAQLEIRNCPGFAEDSRWNRRKLEILLPLLWLFNPFVQNANLFEFHMLVFAPFFLFWMWYFFLKRNVFLFLLSMLGALLVREDVSFVVFMFGIVALFPLKKWRGATEHLQRKPYRRPSGHGSANEAESEAEIRAARRAPGDETACFCADVRRPNGWIWVTAPIILSTLWFFGALTLIGRFAPSGSYKFLTYYSWIGNTPLEILQNTILHPIDILSHMLSYGNLEMIVGFLIPFLFLPLLSPLLLLLAAGPLAQVLLGAPGGSAIILQTHYSMLFLPALFLALIASFKKKIVRTFPVPVPLLLGVASLYGMFTLGPLPSLAQALVYPPSASVPTKTQKELLTLVPKNASLATSYALLAPASSRANVYSLHYAFLGIKQYSQTPYALPEDTEYLLIDFDDLVSYSIQFQNIPPYSDAQAQGYERLRSLLERYHIVNQEGALALFQKGTRAERPLYTLEQLSETSQTQEFFAKREGDILRLVWEIKPHRPNDGTQQNIEGGEYPVPSRQELFKEMNGGIGTGIQKPLASQEIVEIFSGEQTFFLPAAWGLAPDAFQQEGMRVTMFVRLPLSITNDMPVTIRRFTAEGYMTIDGKRSIERKFTKQEYLGEPITLHAEPRIY